MSRLPRRNGARRRVVSPLPAALVLVGLGLMALSIRIGRADDAAAKKAPTTRTVNCTEGGCHAKEIDYKVLHGPTSIGACDTCHEYTDVATHKFKLKREPTKLCTFCHVGQEAGKLIHKPVSEGQCLGCHNPHGSSNRQMLRSDNAGQLCATCHGDVTQARKQVHGPVAAGNCVTCHNAHSSNHPHLLVAEGRGLCLGCHKEMDQQLKEVKYLHEPVKGDCLQCHEPHASNQKMHLRKDPLDLCSSCHANVKDQALKSTHKHTPVTTGDACISCHTPHGSDTAKLMKAPAAKVCLACHDKPIKEDNLTVASVAEIAKPGEFLHGPIRDGNCSGCHNVHGSNESRLLAAPYTSNFYAPFSVEDYELCFTCHSKQMVTTAQTQGLTNFRDGTANLHYVHVNREKGRTCRACHSTHASDHPLHIRDSVPFGNWELPIHFTPTANGGKCQSGCHKPLEYNRLGAVTIKPPGAPATQPDAPPPGPSATPAPATTTAPDTPDAKP
ncbi:MAG: hypothetical protein BIFFINMI_03139 [Phycisphaerae bacterium]|nr:hypothetical protein [Phycisphaerae bacterium]